jgi:hypothetical protein
MIVYIQNVFPWDCEIDSYWLFLQGQQRFRHSKFSKGNFFRDGMNKIMKMQKGENIQKKIHITEVDDLLHAWKLSG